MTDVWVKLAKCCTPVPGDDILGFVTRGGGVSVHRTDCTNAGRLQRKPERMVEVEWAPHAGLGVPRRDPGRGAGPAPAAVRRHQGAVRRAGQHPVGVGQTTRDRVALSRFTFEMGDPAHLGHVLQTVRSVDGVFDAYRVTA